MADPTETGRHGIYSQGRSYEFSTGAKEKTYGTLSMILAYVVE